eukprot:1523225-Pleurochrysis_carterae.AAC.1
MTTAAKKAESNQFEQCPSCSGLSCVRRGSAGAPSLTMYLTDARRRSLGHQVALVSIACSEHEA